MVAYQPKSNKSNQKCLQIWLSCFLNGYKLHFSHLLYNWPGENQMSKCIKKSTRKPLLKKTQLFMSGANGVGLVAHTHSLILRGLFKFSCTFKEKTPSLNNNLWVQVKQGYDNPKNPKMSVVCSSRIIFICRLGVNSTAHLATGLKRKGPNDFLASARLPELQPMPF